MSNAKPLGYADRCARYLPQRGIEYKPEEMSIHRLTPAQRRRALKKEGRGLRFYGMGKPRRADARAARLEARRG